MLSRSNSLSLCLHHLEVILCHAIFIYSLFLSCLFQPPILNRFGASWVVRLSKPANQINRATLRGLQPRRVTSHECADLEGPRNAMQVVQCLDHSRQHHTKTLIEYNSIMVRKTCVHFNNIQMTRTENCIAWSTTIQDHARAQSVLWIFKRLETIALARSLPKSVRISNMNSVRWSACNTNLQNVAWTQRGTMWTEGQWLSIACSIQLPGLIQTSCLFYRSYK